MRPRFNADKTAVEFDGGSIPWLADVDAPVDAEYETGRRYDEIMMQAGMQYPDPYVPPAPPVPTSISDRQFFQQLAIDGIISEDEALAANAAVIPAPLLVIIDQLPAGQRFDAKMKISGATTFLRDDPLTIAIGQAYGMSPGEVDDFFVAAAGL